MTQNHGPTGSSKRTFDPGLQVLQAHSSMPTSRRRPALPRRTSSAPRWWSRSELVERQRLVDTQPRPPQHDEQATQPPPVPSATGRAHHGDDLLDGRRVRRVSLSRVAWRAAGVEAGHRRRGPPTTGGVEQQLGMGPSSGSKASRELRRRRLLRGGRSARRGLRLPLLRRATARRRGWVSASRMTGAAILAAMGLA
jgi:hypothetical protein